MQLPDGLTVDQVREVLASAGLDSADIETVVRADEAESISVERCDFRAKIGNVSKTGEGYLLGTAAVAKVGILAYYQADGSTRRELVTERCLFDSSSMNSLKMKPVTDTHPTQLVNSATAARKKVGFTGETVSKKDNFLTTSLVVTDEAAIQSIDAGRQELSPGYRADVLMRPGTFNNEQYDGIQVRRTYNHLALCDRARGGADLRINFDNSLNFDGFAINEDAVLTAAQRNALPDSQFALVTGTGDDKVRKLPIHDKVHVRNALARLGQAQISPEERRRASAKIRRRAKELGVEVSNDDSLDNDNHFLIQRSWKMQRITLDGIDYEADQQVINHVRKVEGERKDLQTKLDTATKDLEKMTADHDTLKTKNDELEKAAKDEDGLQARVDARLKLVELAREHLDEETVKKLDGMSNLDIQRAVILHRFPDAQEKLDDKETSEDYVIARFDAAVEVLAKEKKDKGGKGTRTDGLAGQRQKATPRTDGKNKTGEDRDQEDARADMSSRATDAWKGPQKKED